MRLENGHASQVVCHAICWVASPNYAKCVVSGLRYVAAAVRGPRLQLTVLNEVTLENGRASQVVCHAICWVASPNYAKCVVSGLRYVAAAVRGPRLQLTVLNEVMLENGRASQVVCHAICWVASPNYAKCVVSGLRYVAAAVRGPRLRLTVLSEVRLENGHASQVVCHAICWVASPNYAKCVVSGLRYVAAAVRGPKLQLTVLSEVRLENGHASQVVCHGICWVASSNYAKCVVCLIF